ncbi:MAG: signal transduction histidine kinase [Firmicutes bacterium]|nr:signal transduction histidine kinase [Bacillota bacterium]
MKRIGMKLWSGMILLVVSVLVILWLFQIVFLNQFYTSLKIAELMKEGNNIVQELTGLTDFAEASGNSGIRDKLENLAYQQQLSIEVIDRAGNTVYQVDNSNNMAGHGMMRNALGEVYQKALNGEVVKEEAEHPRFGSKYMMIGLPVMKDNVVEGAVIMNVPLAPVEDTASILKQQLLWITLLLLMISVLIAFFLSRSFTRPIIKLQQAARRFARGEFDSRVDIRSQDELGELAVSMNRMGEELAKNDQLRKDLIANVSHELRTPLSLIRGYAETLRDVTGEDPQKREKQLGVIIDETVRLSGIVEDILSLSQYQAGAIHLEMNEFLLNEMLEQVMQRYQLIDTDRIIGLEITGKKEVTVRGDRSRLEQVLYNLMNNAINHTVSGGHILLKAIENEKMVRLEVIDDGEGIEQEELPYVFERYYKGKKSERSRRNGTGLGLAIVKNILTMHCVPFGVQSSLGVGTIFWVELKKADVR